MTGTLAAMMTLFGIAILIALFVVPTALASIFGVQWYCAGGSLLFVVGAFALLMYESWLSSRGKS